MKLPKVLSIMSSLTAKKSEWIVAAFMIVLYYVYREILSYIYIDREPSPGKCQRKKEV